MAAVGGKGSCRTRKRRQLPRRWYEGAVARLDGRSSEVRRLREGVEAILQDHGGDEVATYLARRTAFRAAHLDCLLQRDEVAMISGQPIDEERYLSGLSTWLRYVHALGLERHARDAVALNQLIDEAWG